MYLGPFTPQIGDSASLEEAYLRSFGSAGLDYPREQPASNHGMA